MTIPITTTITGAPSPSTVYGSTVNLGSTVTGESGAVTYTWYVNYNGGGNSEVESGTGSAFDAYSFTPSAVGSYTVTLDVSDTADDTGTASASFSVTPATATISVGYSGIYDCTPTA